MLEIAAGDTRVATGERSAERPLNEPIYIRIKHAIIADILAQRFTPGTQLSIDMLVARYGVSHMPIREALQQLAGEGVLTSIAHKGFRVAEITESYIDSIYDIRMALEAVLARRAVERMTDKDQAELEAMHTQLLLDMHNNERARATQTNIAFHKRLNGLSGNPQAIRLLDDRTLIVRTFSLSFGGYSEADRDAVIAEHEAIMAALINRDPDAMTLATFHHVAGARERLKVRISSLQQLPT